MLECVLQLGFDRATVSEVARTLGVDQSALYHHVAGRQAMLTAAADLAFSRFHLPDPGLGWRPYLETLADSLWRFLQDVPGLAGYLTSANEMPRSMIAVILRATGHLSTHGFAPIDGLLLIDSVSDLVLGTIVIRGTLDAPLTRGADDSPMDGTAAQSMREQMLELLSDVPAGTGPELAASMAAILESSRDPTAWWQAKLRLILDGAERLAADRNLPRA